jgi:hypothetical protein
MSEDAEYTDGYEDGQESMKEEIAALERQLAVADGKIEKMKLAFKHKNWFESHCHNKIHSYKKSIKKLGEILDEKKEEIFRLTKKVEELEKALQKPTDFHVHNDEEWKKAHFYAQKIGDYAKPSRCLHCKSEVFFEVAEGWRCKECLALIWGSDFYQGRNSMKAEMEGVKK